MLDSVRLSEALTKYKQSFDSRWPGERYKWEAIKCFQDNWDIKAEDFSDMLSRALSKTSNLLAGRTFSRDRIVAYAAIDANYVRSMFADLFDESKDVYERIPRFKNMAAAFRKEHLSELKGQNRDNGYYQDEKAISIYLWLRFPDTYYSFKLTELQNAANWLRSDYQFRQGLYDENLRNHYALCAELNMAIKKDATFSEMLQNHLADSCYPDEELHTLTFDVIFYISRYLYEAEKPTVPKVKDEEWKPVGYTPNITKATWLELLSDKEIFNDNSLVIMKRMKDYGGIATCTQLAAKYGEEVNFYNAGSSSLARRVANKTNCPVSEREDGSIQWWAILYEGQSAEKDDAGTFIWKLRDELAAALADTDLTSIPLYAEHGNGEIRYWLYAPGHGAEKWDEFYQSGIMGLGWDAIGDLSAYDSKVAMMEEMETAYGTDKKHTNSAYATWQFSHEIKPGDVIFVKRGRGGDILGSGVVKSGYRYDDSRSEYKNVISVEWTHKGEWKIATDKKLPMKTLTDITSFSGMVAKIRDLFDEDEYEEQPAIQYETYTDDDFLREVYMSREQYDSLSRLLKRKKNVILEGAPGVGKTFAAKRLAYSLMGMKDKERVMMVQFHQSYSYEDFIMGHRPTENGFALKTGPFYEFCTKARDDSENDYYFIIDEINRGNLNKIFGELFMLIEADKRDEEIRLLYEDELFSVPSNLYIIGMMNTADRSLALLDYALRRRFSFFVMKPGFDTAGFKKYQAGFDDADIEVGRKFGQTIKCVKGLNQVISEDETLGDSFSIGHSYFCGLTAQDIKQGELDSIVEYEIIPLIKEYWFDEPTKAEEWIHNLRSALQ